MNSLKYAVRTALVLTLLEVVLTSSQASGRIGGLANGLSQAFTYLLSPAYPLVPDRRKATAAPSSGSGSSDNSGGVTILPPAPISVTPPTSTGVISV